MSQKEKYLKGKKLFNGSLSHFCQILKRYYYTEFIYELLFAYNVRAPTHRTVIIF